MNFKSYISAFLVLSSLSAMAQDPAEGKILTAMVSTHSIPTVKNETAKDIICISQKWHQQDMLTSISLKKLVANASQAIAFDVADHHCFIKSRLTSDNNTELLTILNRIDKISSSAITVPIEIQNLDGQADCLADSDPLKNLNSNQKDLTIEVDQFRNYDKSLGRQILRGVGLIQGSQAVGIGILLMLPKSITKWEDDALAGSKILKAYKRNVGGGPVWDKDEWVINYVGHPLSGALYYNALRSQGASPLASFVFSTGQSLTWEYGVEAFFERPSIQDLLFTSTIGSVFGEAAHRATIKMNKNGFNTLEKVVVTIINPSFVFNNGYKKKNLKRN